MSFKIIASIAVGLVLVLAALFTGVAVISNGNSITGLLASTLELREKQDEQLQKAKLVSDIDELVADLDDADITAQWSTFTECIAVKQCADDDFLDFLITIISAKESKIANAGLIIDVIKTHRYWGNQDYLIEFSKALTSADNGIEAMQAKHITAAWKNIVVCDGSCPEYNDLFFGIIRQLLDA